MSAFTLAVAGEAINENTLPRALAELERRCLDVPTDRLACGGILDYVRASVICDDEAGLCACCDLLRGAPDDELLVVREKNGYHGDARAAGYRDVKLNLIRDRRGAHAVVGEVQLVLRGYIEIKEFSHLPYEVIRGDF